MTTSGKFRVPATGAVNRQVGSKLQEGVSVFDFLTPTQIADVVSNTASLDLAIALQAAFNSFGGAYDAGCLHFPAGSYKWTGSITVPGRVSFYGDGIATQFKPTSNGFIILDNSYIGGTFIRDFTIMGSSEILNTAFSFVPGTDPTKWLQGLNMSRVIIDTFLTGINAKNVRHAKFDHVGIKLCFTGIRLLGQTVSTVIDSCKIQHGNAVHGDGSIGIELVASTAYGDAASRQPEAIKIIGETIVYGYDTNLYVKDCLNFLIQGCDLDASLKYGARVLNCTGGCGIKDNYIACIHQPGLIVYGARFDDPGVPRNTPIWVEDNQFQFYGTPVGGSTALDELGNRTGVFVIKGNHLAGGNLAAVGLSVVSSNITIEDNFIGGSAFSLVTAAGSTGHQILRNQLLSPIVRDAANSGLDNFQRNRGVGNTVTTGYHGPVTVPSGATTVTVTLASLGLAAVPTVGTAAFLTMVTHGFQWTGGVSRGKVRARYDNTNSIVVDVEVPVGIDSGDIWVDMEAT